MENVFRPIQTMRILSLEIHTNTCTLGKFEWGDEKGGSPHNDYKTQAHEQREKRGESDSNGCVFLFLGDFQKEIYIY